MMGVSSPVLIQLMNSVWNVSEKVMIFQFVRIWSKYLALNLHFEQYYILLQYYYMTNLPEKCFQGWSAQEQNLPDAFSASHRGTPRPGVIKKHIKALVASFFSSSSYIASYLYIIMSTVIIQ